MTIRASLQDLAALKAGGYTVERWNETGWVLRDSDGASLMIGDYGSIAPSQWEAVAEGLARIAQDSR